MNKTPNNLLKTSRISKTQSQHIINQFLYTNNEQCENKILKKF